MLKAGVWIPFKFRIAELLLCFCVAPMFVTPRSWKIIRVVLWFCKWREYRADRYLWRELLVCKLLQGYVAFAEKGDVKLINNFPNPTPKWKSRGTPQVIDLEEEGDASLLREHVALLKSREVRLLSECKAARSEAARLREEIRALRAEVMHLQASLLEGDVRYLAIVEYHRSDVHRHWEEFKRSHYSQSGYLVYSFETATLHLETAF
ncbi:hypothetical protein ACLOJK_018038 [Asimina triloba]